MGAATTITDDFDEKRNQVLIKRLQEELSCSEEDIARVYIEVLSTLKQGARIVDYLPVLTCKIVKDLFRSNGFKCIVGK